ncbi:MAG: glycosyltransferase [Proteobacteria bacterium]|nr:glycosyltransferase [Pseudomonadota bacterium]MBU1611567.1 glycosyltransferase [Pseudomonadota bacterium]
MDLVAELSRTPGVEVVVVDGDPLGSTLDALHGTGVKTCTAGPGRAAQMNAGAGMASGEILLFLHADTKLPEGWLSAVREVLGRGFARCGAFGLEFCAAGLPGRWIGAWARFRSRLDRRPYGDQAQFFAADFFQELGGYADLPIMEDVEIMGRAVLAGHPPSILPLRVQTSFRRYQAEGWLKRGALNILMRAAFALGVPATRLSGWYRPHTPTETAE